jgi:hypothetical protein
MWNVEFSREVGIITILNFIAEFHFNISKILFTSGEDYFLFFLGSVPVNLLHLPSFIVDFMNFVWYAISTFVVWLHTGVSSTSELVNYIHIVRFDYSYKVSW